jgi:hypothetical protein
MTKMVEKETSMVAYGVIAVLGILLLIVAAHDLYEAPEVKYLESTCPVITLTEQVANECPVCETCEVCAVYEAEFVADYEQDRVVEELCLEEVGDKDLKEELMEWMNAEFSFNIEDVDDLEFTVEDFDVEWSDREDGEAMATLTLKTSYILDGDDDDSHTKRVDVKMNIEDEDLEEVEDYAFQRH